jgi:hypothetical protein
MDRLPPPWRRATKRTVPLINSFTASVKLTDVISGELRGMQRVLVTPSLPLGDTIAVSALAAYGVRSGCGVPAHVRCHASRSMRLRICPSRRRVKGSALRSALRSWGRYARNSATWGAAHCRSKRESG